MHILRIQSEDYNPCKKTFQLNMIYDVQPVSSCVKCICILKKKFEKVSKFGSLAKYKKLKTKFSPKPHPIVCS